MGASTALCSRRNVCRNEFIERDGVDVGSGGCLRETRDHKAGLEAGGKGTMVLTMMPGY